MRVNTQPEAWLSVDPVSAHFLPPQAVGNDLMFNVGLVANLSLSTEKPTTPEAEPLPTLGKAPPSSSGFKIGLPIKANYAMLEEALIEALGRTPITVATPAGDAKVQVEKVTVYPSAPRLVVGAKVTVDLPDRWLDTKGWVYLFAEPSFDAESKVLRLKNIGFARSVDNSFVRFATAAFVNQIESEIEKRSDVDMSDLLDRAVEQANMLLNKDLSQWMREQAEASTEPLNRLVAHSDVTGTIDGLTSVSFLLEDDKLTLIPVVTGSLTVELQPMPQTADVQIALR